MYKTKSLVYQSIKDSHKFDKFDNFLGFHRRITCLLNLKFRVIEIEKY